MQFAALFLDLDGFKEVNDELGHEAGDAVIQGIAERLSHQVRGHDMLARLGGDEFVVVLNDLGDRNHALSVARRICKVAAAPFSIGDSVVTLAVSIGVAYAQPGRLRRHGAQHRGSRHVRGEAIGWQPLRGQPPRSGLERRLKPSAPEADE